MATTKKTTKSTVASRKAKRAKTVASNADHITICKHTADGAYVYVEAGDGRSFTRLRSGANGTGDTKEFQALAKVGLPYAAAERFNNENPVQKPQARLARGAEGRMTEHSRKAVADQKKVAPKGKTAAPKAAKNKAPSRGAERDYTVGKTEVTAKPDSWRGYMLTLMRKHGNTAKAKAAHAKSGKFSSNKLDFNWAAAQGYIVWSK